MPRRYTAQEMRDMAEQILFTDDDWYADAGHMLIQAADMMERESKYEYGVKFHGCDGSARIDNMHFRSLSEANEFNEVIGLDETTVVRRSVGEWEEVMDGKDKISDIDSDTNEASIGLGIHITREDIKKCSPDDAVFSKVLVGEWEDGK